MWQQRARAKNLLTQFRSAELGSWCIKIEKISPFLIQFSKHLLPLWQDISKISLWKKFSSKYRSLKNMPLVGKSHLPIRNGPWKRSICNFLFSGSFYCCICFEHSCNHLRPSWKTFPHKEMIIKPHIFIRTRTIYVSYINFYIFMTRIESCK